MIDALWITWERHRRTRSMAAALAIDLVELDAPGRFPIRHAILAAKTIHQLWHTTPTVLVVQNPSLILATLSVVLRPLAPWILVVDAHNEAIDPIIRAGRLKKWLSRFVLRTADLTIVTNPSLASNVEKRGGRALVLPDPLPSPGGNRARQWPVESIRRPRVAIICTYAIDEPLRAIFAATYLMQEFDFHVTGDARHYDSNDHGSTGDNVTFTGFLEDDDYWDLMRTSDVVLDLTLMENCLACGAYEAVAVGTPPVLTDGHEARQLFRMGAVFTKPDPNAVADAVRDAVRRRYELAAKLPELQRLLRREWWLQANLVMTHVRELVSEKTQRLGS